MGTHEGFRRCSPMDAQGRICSGHRAGCPRPVEEARPDDVHDGPRIEVGPELREDFEAFPRELAGVRRCLCQGMVQAYAPGHGATAPLSWPARSRGALDL